MKKNKIKSETVLILMNRSDLHDTEFEIIVKNMFTKIRRTIRIQNRNFNEEIEKKLFLSTKQKPQI